MRSCPDTDIDPLTCTVQRVVTVINASAAVTLINNYSMSARLT